MSKNTETIHLCLPKNVLNYIKGRVYIENKKRGWRQGKPLRRSVLIKAYILFAIEQEKKSMIQALQWVEDELHDD